MGPRWAPSHRSSSRTTSNDARLPTAAAGAIPSIAVWGWFALVQHDQTPIFVYLNIAVHETGHVLFRPSASSRCRSWAPASKCSSRSPLAPTSARRRNLVAAAVCGGWAASALASAATYIADADDGRLALLGRPDPMPPGTGSTGAEFFDKVYLADPIAAKVRVLGFVLWFASLGLAAWVIVRNTRGPATGPRRTAVRPPTSTPPLDDERMWR